jgi:HEAT repeat protein
MTLALFLSFLGLPVLFWTFWRMWRAYPSSRSGRYSFWLLAFVLLPLFCLLAPVPLLSRPLPAFLDALLREVQSFSRYLSWVTVLAFLAGAVLLIFSWWGGERRFVKRAAVYSALTLLLNPFVMVWAVAGADGWFLRSVPIDQRLVSHNDTIRKKAQQELLGLEPEAKHGLVSQLIPALSAEDRFVRKWAAISLALIGPPAQDAIPTLLQGVSGNEKDVAQAYRVALSEIGAPDPQQLPALLQDIGDPREAVRCEAAATVARMGSGAQEAVAPLSLQVKRSAEVPQCLGTALARLLDALPESASGLVDWLGEPEAAARRNAAFVFSEMEHRPEAALRPLLIRLADDEDPATRRYAARALHLKYAPERGRPGSLIFAFRRSDAEAVKLQALALLEESGWKAEDALPVLSGALQDENAVIRRQALISLGRWPTRRSDVLSAIAKTQRGWDSDLRCLAAQQLVEWGAWDRVAVALLAADVRRRPENVACAVTALGMAGHFNAEVVPATLRLLEEKDPETRRLACLILMQLGPKAKDALPALAKAQKENVPGAENALRAIRDSLPRPAPTVRRSHRR